MDARLQSGVDMLLAYCSTLKACKANFATQRTRENFIKPQSERPSKIRWIISNFTSCTAMIELSDFNLPSSLPNIESISCGDFCARCSSLWKVRRIQGNQKLGKLENWKFPLALDVCRMTRREKRRHELGAERQERNFQFEFSLTNGE